VFVTLLALSFALGSTVMLVSTIQGINSDHPSGGFAPQTAAATYQPPVSNAASTNAVVTLQIVNVEDEQLISARSDQ
jgi:hypothetical protein